MAKKITFERWIVMVNRNDGISFEKLELDFIPDFEFPNEINKGKHIERRDEDGKIIREMHPESEVQMTQEEADDLNKQSEFNGIRYYAKG